MARRAARLPVLLAALALAACATEEAEVPCPRIEVLREVAEVVRFADGTGRDATDVVMRSWIDRAGGGCVVDSEEVAVDLALVLTTTRGPADRDGKADVDFFVAVADKDRNILNRRAFKASVPYGSRRTVSFQENIDLRIPQVAGRAAEDYRIYVGFDLSREELEYNRNRLRGRGPAS